MFLVQTCPSLFYNPFRNGTVKTILISELISILFSNDRADPAVFKGQCFVAYRGLDLKISWLHVRELGKSINSYHLKVVCLSGTISFWIAKKAYIVLLYSCKRGHKHEMWIDRSNSQPTIYLLVHCMFLGQNTVKSDGCLWELHL